MAELMKYLKFAVENGASDILIIAGGPVCAKVDGHMVPADDERVLPPQAEELLRQIYEAAKRPMDLYLQTRDDDFSFSVPGLARFRVNAFRQRGSMAAVIRIVSFEIPDWQKLRIPEKVMELSNVDHGMILVTGTAGSNDNVLQRQGQDHGGEGLPLGSADISSTLDDGVRDRAQTGGDHECCERNVEPEVH